MRSGPRHGELPVLDCVVLGKHLGGQKNPEAEGTVSTTGQGGGRKFLIV